MPRYVRNADQRQALIDAVKAAIEVHMPICSCEESDESWLDNFPFDMSLAEAEKAIILRTLIRTQGNRTRAAEVLGISLRGLRNKLDTFEGVPPPPPSSSWAATRGREKRRLRERGDVED